MTNGYYTVSTRDGDTYESATYFAGEAAEADAIELANSLAKTSPGLAHNVMSEEAFITASEAAAKASSETVGGGN